MKSLAHDWQRTQAALTTMLRTRCGAPRSALMLACWCAAGISGCAVSEQAELLDRDPAPSSAGGSAGNFSTGGSNAGTQGGAPSAGGGEQVGAGSMAGSASPPSPGGA